MNIGMPTEIKIELFNESAEATEFHSNGGSNPSQS
jgi:hypothetical protein